MKNKKQLKKVVTYTSLSSVLSLAVLLSPLLKAKDVNFKSNLHYIVDDSSPNLDEYEFGKERPKASFFNGDVLYLPFTHEIIKALLREDNQKATIQREKAFQYGHDTRIRKTINLTDDEAQKIYRKAIASLFNKENYGDRYRESDGKIRFGTEWIDENSITFASKDPHLNQGNSEVYIYVNNDQSTSRVIPVINYKVASAEHMEFVYKAIFMTKIRALNKQAKIDIPRLDFKDELIKKVNGQTIHYRDWSNTKDERTVKPNETIFYGNTEYVNEVGNIIGHNKDNFSAHFDPSRAKFFYDSDAQTLVAYDTENHSTFLFPDYDTFIEVDELLDTFDLYRNKHYDVTKFSPYANPNLKYDKNGQRAEDRIDVEGLIKKKYTPKNGNITLGEFNISDFDKFATFRSINVRQINKNVWINSRDHLKHKKMINRNPNISWRFIDINRKVNDGKKYHIFESKAYIFTIGSFADVSYGQEYYQGVLAVYEAFKNKKRISALDLKKATTNHPYFFNHFFKYGNGLPLDRQNGGEVNGVAIENRSITRENVFRDERSLDMDFKDEFEYLYDDIKLEIVDFGDRLGLLITNAVSYNWGHQPGELNAADESRDHFATKPVTYLIDEFPRIVDETKFEAPKLSDFVKYSRIRESKTGPVQETKNLPAIRNKGLDENIWNLFYGKGQTGWVIYQKLKNESSFERGGKRYLDFYGKELDLEKIAPLSFYNGKSNDKYGLKSIDESLLRDHYALVEIDQKPSGYYENTEINKGMMRLRGIVKYLDTTVQPWFPMISSTPVNNYNSQDILDIKFPWGQRLDTTSISNNKFLIHNSAAFDDGAFTIYYFLKLVETAKEVNYSNPIPSLPADTSLPKGFQNHQIIHNPSEPPKKFLYDEQAKLDLRDGYANYGWVSEADVWAADHSKPSMKIGGYFIDYFKERNPNYPDLNKLYTNNSYRYSNDYTTGVLTGLETIQYWPDNGIVTISDNGYYKDWDDSQKKLVLKLRTKKVKNGSETIEIPDPINFIIDKFGSVEITHNIISPVDLAKAGWNRELALKNKINNLPNSNRIEGAKVLTENLHVYSPKFEGLYGLTNPTAGKNLFNPESDGFANYPIRDENRFRLSFITAGGEKKNIFLLDYDINEVNTIDGSVLFSSKELEFKNFFEGVLKPDEGKKLNSIQNNSEIVKLINDKVTEEANKQTFLAGFPNHERNQRRTISDIEVYRVGDELVVSAKVDRTVPYVIRDVLKPFVNPDHQRYNIRITNLPLIYYANTINVNIPEVNNLIEMNMTTQDYLLDQINNSNVLKKNGQIIFGAENNPDIRVDNIKQLEISHIDYNKRIFTVKNIKTGATVEVKADKPIPEVKFLSAHLTNDNDKSKHNYGDDLAFTNYDLYHNLLTLKVNGKNFEPDTLYSVSDVENSNQNTKFAHKLFTTYNELVDNYGLNLRKNSTSAKIKYDSAHQRLIILDDYSDVTENLNGNNPVSKKPSALVLYSLPPTVWSYEIFKNANSALNETGDAAKNHFINEILKKNGEIIETLKSEVDKIPDSQDNNHQDSKLIAGNYIKNPKVLPYLKQRNLITIQSDEPIDNNNPTVKREIGVFDEYSYFLSNVDGEHSFTDYNKLLETITNATNTETDVTKAFKYDLNNNSDLVKINNENLQNNRVFVYDVSKKLANETAPNADDQKVKVKFVSFKDSKGNLVRRFIVKGYVSENFNPNKKAIYLIDNVPNVIKATSDFLVQPTEADIINANGNEYQATLKKWKDTYLTNPSSRPQTQVNNGKLIINDQEIDIDKVELSLDDTRKILTIADKTNHKRLAIVLYDSPYPKLIGREQLYTWRDYVDASSNLSNTINDKIARLFGAKVNNQYVLDGYTYDSSSNFQYGYQIKKGNDVIKIIDDYIFDPKTNAGSNDKTHNGEQVFKDNEKFLQLYESLSDKDEKKLSDLNDKVSDLKAYLKADTSLDTLFKDNDEVALIRYKDTIVVFSKKAQDSNGIKGRRHLIVISHLPGIFLDTKVGVKVPSINDLIEKRKELKDLLKENIFGNSTSKTIGGNEYHKDQVQFSFDYINNIITLKEVNNGKTLSTLIKTETPLSNVVFVDAKNTIVSSSSHKDKMKDLSSLANAKFLVDLYNNIEKGSGYVASPRDKLFNTFDQSFLQERDASGKVTFDFKEQLSELSKLPNYDSLSEENKKATLLQTSSQSLTVNYVRNDVINNNNEVLYQKDTLIIKDGGKTPVAVVISNLPRYTTNKELALPNFVGASNRVNLDIKTKVDTYINALPKESDGSVILDGYKMFSPEFHFFDNNENFSYISYKESNGASTTKKMYLVNSNKYHDQITWQAPADFNPYSLYILKTVSSGNYVNKDALKADHVKALFDYLLDQTLKNKGADFTDIKYKFTNTNKANSIIIQATKKNDGSGFPERTYLYKISKIPNITNDRGELRTPTVFDVINTNFDYDRAFKVSWIKGNNDQYEIDNLRATENEIFVDYDRVSRRHTIIYKNDGTLQKDTNEQGKVTSGTILGYVVLRQPLEKIAFADYKDAPAEEVHKLFTIADELKNEVNKEENRKSLKELNHVIKEKIKDFDKMTDEKKMVHEANTLSLLVRSDNSVLIYDTVQPTSNYLLLKNVPYVFNSRIFYNQLSLVDHVSTRTQLDLPTIAKDTMNELGRINGVQLSQVEVNPSSKADNNKGYYQFKFKIPKGDGSQGTMDSPVPIFIYDVDLYEKEIYDGSKLKLNEDANFKGYAELVRSSHGEAVKYSDFESNYASKVATLKAFLEEKKTALSLTSIDELRVKGSVLIATGKTNDGKVKHFFINKLPIVVDPSGIYFPTRDTIIYDHFGNVNEALDAELKNKNTNIPTKDGKLKVFDEAIDADKIVLRFQNKDNEIIYYLKQDDGRGGLTQIRKKEFSPLSNLGEFHVTDALGIKTTLQPRDAYLLSTLIDKAPASSLSPNLKTVTSELKSVSYISTHKPLSLNLDYGSVEFVRDKRMIVFRGVNTAGKAVHWIINNVPRSLPRYDDLYTIDDVVNNEFKVKETVEKNLNKLPKNTLKGKEIKHIGSTVDGFDIELPLITQDFNAKSNSIELRPENKTDKNFNSYPIFILDEIKYLPIYDANAVGKFRVRNDVEIIRNNTGRDFVEIEKNEELKKLNSLNEILDARDIGKEAKIKVVNYKNQLAYLIVGKDDSNQKKALLITNLPTIINDLEINNQVVYPVVDGEELIDFGEDVYNHKQRIELAIKNKIMSRLNGSTTMKVNGLDVNVKQIFVQLNNNVEPNEIAIFNGDSFETASLLGTYIVPSNQKLPNLHPVSVPDSWKFDPLNTYLFLEKLWNLSSNGQYTDKEDASEFLKDPEFKKILPADFDKKLNLKIFYNPTYHTINIFNNEESLIARNVYNVIDANKVYNLNDVVFNNNQTGDIVEKNIKALNDKHTEYRLGAYTFRPQSQPIYQGPTKGHESLLVGDEEYFIIDLRKYIQPIESRIVFSDNKKLNNTVAILKKISPVFDKEDTSHDKPIREMRLLDLNDDQINEYFKKIGVNARDAVVGIIEQDGLNVLYIKENNRVDSKIFVINNLPTFINLSNLPSIDDLISFDGDLQKAFISKNTNSNGKVVVNGKEYDPNDITVTNNKDGSITIGISGDKPITIVPVKPYPVSRSVEADVTNYRRYRDITEEISYEKDNLVGNQKLIDMKDKVEKPYAGRILNHPYLSSVIDRNFSFANLSGATIKYDKSNNKISIYKAPDSNDNGYLFVIKNVPRVIRITDFVGHDDAISHITEIDNYVLEKLKSAVNGSTSQLNHFDFSVNVQLNKVDLTDYIITDGNTTNKKLPIYVISDFNFIDKKVNASTIFKNFKAFNSLRKEVENRKLENVESIFLSNENKNGLSVKEAANTELNQFIKESDVLTNFDKSKLVIASIEGKDYWVLHDGKSVVVLEDIPKVSDEDDAFQENKHLPDINAILNHNGNFEEAIKNSLKGDDGKIHINGVVFDPNNMTIQDNRDGTLSFIDNNTKVKVSVILNNPWPDFTRIDALRQEEFTNIQSVYDLRYELENAKHPSGTVTKGGVTFGYLKDITHLFTTTDEEQNALIKKVKILDKDSILPSKYRSEDGLKTALYYYDAAHDRLTINTNVSGQEEYIVIYNIQKVKLASSVYKTHEIVKKNLSVEEFLKDKIKNSQLTIDNHQFTSSTTITKTLDQHYKLVDGQTTIYLVDGIVYDQNGLKSSIEFDSQKQLFEFIFKLDRDMTTNDEFVKLNTLRGPDGDLVSTKMIQTLTSQKQFNWREAEIQKVDDNIYVIRGVNTVQRQVYVFTFTNDINLQSFGENEIDLLIATDEEVRIAKSVEEAYRKKLNELATDEGGKKVITIDNVKYDVSNLDIINNPDKSIDIVQKNPRKKLLSLVDETQLSDYDIVDLNKVGDFGLNTPKKINDVFKLLDDYRKIDATPGANKKEVPLKKIIQGHPELISYLTKNHDFDVNDENATFFYDDARDQIVIKDNKATSGKVFVLNDIPRVYSARELYLPENVLLNNNSFVKTINQGFTNKPLEGDKRVFNQGNKLVPPFYITLNSVHHYTINDSNKDTSPLVLVDDYTYNIERFIGNTIFSEVKNLERLVTQLRNKNLNENEEDRYLSLAEVDNTELTSFLTNTTNDFDLTNAKIKLIAPEKIMLILDKNQPKNKGKPDVHLIDQVPYVLDTKEKDDFYPSVEEIIQSNGFIEDAVLKKINNLQTNEGGNVTLGKKTFNPKFAEVIAVEGGYYKVFLKSRRDPSKKTFIAAIGPETNFDNRVFFNVDASTVDHRKTYLINEIFKNNITKEENKDQPLQYKIHTRYSNLIVNSDFKSLVSKNKDVNAGLISVKDDAEVQYRPNQDRYIVQGGDPVSNSPVYIIIYNVKRVIDHTELYNNNDVNENTPISHINSILLNRQNEIDELQSKLESSEPNFNKDTDQRTFIKLGNLNYLMKKPSVDVLKDKEKIDNDSIVIDSFNHTLYIIDRTNYMTAIDSTIEQFNNEIAYNNLVAKLNEQPNQFIKADAINSPEVNEYITKLGLDPKDTSLKYDAMKNIIKVVSTKHGNDFIGTIPGIVNTLSTNYIEIGNDLDAIKFNGNQLEAIKEKINEKAVLRNGKKYVKLGNREFDLNEYNIKKDDNIITFYRVDEGSGSTTPIVKIIVETKDRPYVLDNYTGYRAAELNEDALSILIRDMKKKGAPDGKQMSASEFAKHSIVRQLYGKEKVDLNKVTFEFREDGKKLIIRDHNKQPTLVSVIYSLPAPAPDVEEGEREIFDIKKTKIHIWLPIVLSVFVLALAIPLAIWFTKKRQKLLKNKNKLAKK
ncbi:GUMAP protein [Ureaplasma canigenitalium]|uniref:GUMAP protein n=1 Tax=Ureaplasma canigenitalium TaxID=42092 RepID=UPI0004E0F826|nr:GUMAP protein [Ureaplasma canigenitalium]